MISQQLRSTFSKTLSIVQSSHAHRLSLAAVLLLLVANPSNAQIASGETDSTVLELLDQVETALTEVSYSGIYTYEHTGFMDTIEITHKVVAGRMQSRLQHLSGRAAKPMVHGDGIDECLPDLELRQSHFDRETLDKYYRFQLLGDDRVAGRDVLLLSADPRDEFRYGYRLAIDKETYVPLLLSLFNGKRMMERFQFVDFQPLASTADTS